MSHQQPIIAVDILSDDEDEDAPTPNHHPLVPTQSKKRQRRTLVPNSSSSSSNPISTTTTTVFLIDDDPTPKKLSIVDDETPMSCLFVAETPLSTFPTTSTSTSSHVSFLKCTNQVRSSKHPHHQFTGISGLISLESDDESENRCGRENFEQNKTMDAVFDMEKDQESSSRFLESAFSMRNENLTQISGNSSSYPIFPEDDFTQVNDHLDQEIIIPEPVGNALNQKVRRKANANKKENMAAADGQKKIMKEERIRLMEEKRQQKERERLQKAAMKAEAAEMKKLQKEKQKWEKGKFALKSIVAEIDTKVVELGLVGGHLLTRFAEKGLIYRITSNPIERSIVWTMTVPEEISQFSSNGIEIPYVLIIFEAEEFCNLVSNGYLLDHVSCVRSRYPSHTICYVTNKLMAYINKREQGQYKNPEDRSDWRRPPVEEVLSKLTTHFIRVHSRQCIDEAELAEHVVGLTCSLASCQFRKKLTRLSVNANGSLISKDCIDKNLIKKSLWLKALVAIPKVQPRFAMAIWKKYPTMKSLLSVYMNPSKSVHEKEFLLKDLTTEALLGEDRRLGEVCSKRVYRILMAQCGSIKTDDVEDGADFFSRQSS